MAIAMLGAVATWNSLGFDVSIEPYESLRPSDPFETLFVITNQSSYAINDLRYNCAYVGVKAGDRKLSKFIRVDASNEDLLPPHAKRSLNCSMPAIQQLTPGVSQLITEAVLQVDVSYRPSFWPWRKTGGARFFLQRNDSGKSVWLPIGRTVSMDELLKNGGLPFPKADPSTQR